MNTSLKTAMRVIKRQFCIMLNQDLQKKKKRVTVRKPSRISFKQRIQYNRMSFKQNFTAL